MLTTTIRILPADYTVGVNIPDTNQGGYYGWTLKWEDSFMSTTTAIGDTPVDITTLNSFTLNSVTINVRNSAHAELSNQVYLAVYQYASDGTTGTFVGVSSNATTGSETLNAPFTFDFSGLAMESGQQYQYLFVTTNDTDQISSFEGYKAHAAQFGVRLSQSSATLPQGDGTYTASGLNAWELNNYIPTVSYSVSAMAAVPEPATATLSLLALAGLAARRRRR